MIEKKKQNYVKFALSEFISKMEQIGLSFPESIVLMRMYKMNRPVSIDELAYDAEKSYTTVRNTLNKFYKLGFVNREKVACERGYKFKYHTKIYVFTLFGG